jgi:hypothetical protein
MKIGLIVLGVIVLLGALFGTLAATGVLSGQGSSTTCTDSDECCGWADSGECDSNPDWMSENCPVACGISDLSDAEAADEAADEAAANGCTDESALNYKESATTDDGSCTYVEGCMNSSADNYNVNATRDDGTCIISGCTDSSADNYNVDATTDDGTCIISGCTDSSADNYNVDATTDDGTCIISGCTRLGAQNYNVDAATDDGSCTFLNTTNNMLELPAKPFNLRWVYEYLKNTDTLDEDTGVQIGKYDGTTSQVTRDAFGNYVRELVGSCVGEPICGGTGTLASLGNGSDLNAIKTRINECYSDFEDDTKCGNNVYDQTYRIINTYEPTTMDEAKDMVKYFIDNGIEYDDLGPDIGSGEDVGAIFGNFIRTIRGNELVAAGGVAFAADSFYNLANNVGNNNSSQWNELLTTVRDS